MKKFFPLLMLCCAFCAGAAERPNIIIILADDLGYGDLSCYGQDKIKTPNIDSIAEMGMKFTRHYSGSTVCAPSRNSLMTGLHTGHSYIRGNRGSAFSKDGDLDFPPETPTISKALKGAGYATGVFGKWGMGAQESPSAPLKTGFDSFFGYNGQWWAHNYYPPYLWNGAQKLVLEGNEARGRKTYSADLIQAEALKFVEKNIDAKKPFFLYYATTIPHAEMLVPEKYMGEFRGKFGEETPFEGKGSYSPQPEPRAAFAGMMKALDAHVGQIISALKEKGQLENTLIIFTSDNGTHSEGGHDPLFWNSSGGLRGGKRDLYEGGIRAPFLACWKGKIRAGSTSAHISAFWDVFATVAEIAGAGAPENTDGISFAPALFGGAQKTHDYLYWEFHEQGGKQAVLKDGFKLVKLFAKQPHKTKYELYDICADSAERFDIIAENHDKAEELKAVMEAARTESPVEQFNFPK